MGSNEGIYMEVHSIIMILARVVMMIHHSIDRTKSIMAVMINTVLMEATMVKRSRDYEKREG